MCVCVCVSHVSIIRRQVPVSASRVLSRYNYRLQRTSIFTSKIGGKMLSLAKAAQQRIEKVENVLA